MHVAMVTDVETDAAQVPALTDTLLSRGHRVTVHTPDDDAGGPAERGERLAREWRRRPPDVAHAFSPNAGMAVVAGRQDHEVPLVQDYRPVEGAQLDRQDPQWLRLEVALGRRAERVVVSSRTHADRLTARGVPRPKVATVPYGVDLSVVEPGRFELERVCRHRLVSVDGGAEVVRALAQVPDAELVLAVDDGGRLAKLAAELGLTDRVRFAGALDDRELARLYRSADLAVNASADGTLDTTLLRAMACGTAVVSIAGEGADDLVVDGVTGVLVPTAAPGRLAGVIRELLAHAPRRAAYGIAGADRVSACHSWDRVADRVERVYTSAISGHYTATDTKGTYTPG